MKIKMIEDFQGELIDNKFYKGEKIRLGISLVFFVD